MITVGIDLAPQDRETGLARLRWEPSRVVEVYPKASLNEWGFTLGKYKNKENVAALSRLVDELLAKTGGSESASWLEFEGDAEARCRKCDDAFDAVIAALTARAATANDLVTWPNEEQCRTAQLEGWIAVPKPGSLSRLVGG